MRVGVTLMTYGAPAGPDDLPAYLARVRGGKAPSGELVSEMRRRYEVIGGSPLIAITRSQAACVERELGPGHRVVAGMRFSDPSIDAAVAELAASGCGRIVGICLSPQWSPLLMGGYERALGDAVAAHAPGTPHVMVRAWHRTSELIDALAANIATALATLPEDVPVLLTAHSLPRRVFEAEPDYIGQLRETGELVAARARLPADRWRWAYQSAGHTAEEWLRPDLKELFASSAAAGHGDVLIAPVQFLADHLEVLYDLDVAARAEAEAARLRYHRVAMPNADPAFIRALAAVVNSAA
ncbi:MAG: ferrochelatase [Chloroflexota bacterium]|nr:ferrochelatase [Chloroflexota bacterium]